MYEKLIQEHFYGNLATFMKSGLCMILLITGVDAVQRMNQLKHVLRKEHEEGWIKLTDQDLKLWHANSHPNQTTLNIKLVAANLIHVCDSEEESHRCAELIFNS